MSAIAWPCSVCAAHIANGCGYVLVDVLAARDSLRAGAAWQRAHSGPVDVHELLSTFPAEVQWHAVHRRCDPDPDSASEYVIDVERIRSPWDVIGWTAHLMGKNWLEATNWSALIRSVAMRAGVTSI